MNHSSLVRSFLGGFLIFALACQHAAPVATARSPDADAPHVVVWGPLRLALRISNPAASFYVVDQLSAWNPNHHEVYQQLLQTPAPSTEENAALAAQRTLRARLPSGSGLEQAYLLGHADGLNASERGEEDGILATFEPRLRSFFAQQRVHLEHFARRAQEASPAVAPWLGRLGQLLEAPMLDVPVVLVPRPGRGGGGGASQGGVLVVEVTADEASLTPLLREAVHRLFALQRPRLKASARACGQGLDWERLEEGLTRAVAPGMIHDGAKEEDVLARLAHDHNGGDDKAYAFALAVRPSVEKALRGDGATSLDELLTQACGVWRALP